MDTVRNNVGYHHVFTEEPVEEILTESFMEALCEGLNLKIITTHKDLATDLNNFYCGYKLHKKTYKNHRNNLIASLKATNEKNDHVFTSTSKLLKTLKELSEHKGGVVLSDLNANLSVMQKSEPCKNWEIEDLIEKLEILKKVTNSHLLFTGGYNYESSSKEWFIGKAIPLIFEHHTGRSHTRSYSAGTGSCGVTHIFIKEILGLLEDFSDMSDSAIDSAIGNYKSNLEKNREKINNGEVSLYIFPPKPFNFSDIIETIEAQLK